MGWCFAMEKKKQTCHTNLILHFLVDQRMMKSAKIPFLEIWSLDWKSACTFMYATQWRELCGFHFWFCIVHLGNALAIKPQWIYICLSCIFKCLCAPPTSIQIVTSPRHPFWVPLWSAGLISGQKLRGRQLNSKVCDSKSAIFHILSFFLSFFLNNNSVPLWLQQPPSFVPRLPHSPTVQTCVHNSMLHDLAS